MTFSSRFETYIIKYINWLGAIVPILEHTVWSYPAFIEKRLRLFGYKSLFRNIGCFTKHSL